MKVRFIRDCESPDFGAVKKGDVIDIEPKIERLLIKRGIAVLSSSKPKKRGAKNGNK